MALYTDSKVAGEALRSPVVAVGNFDGVHRGHQGLLAQVRELADSRGVDAAVLTFEPHPVQYFRPETPNFRLMTNQQRADVLAQFGIDGVLALNFDAELAALSPLEFVDQMLHHGLGASVVMVGEGFQFGAKRAGNTEVLKQLCAERGIEVVLMSPVQGAGETISSTRIREAVREADFDAAAALLGRPFSVVGEVVHGDARGRTMGFPTANIDVTNELLPPDGIYATRVIDEELGSMDAAAYIGARPTFEGAGRSIEAYVIDRENLKLYGRYVTLEFVGRVRGDQKFKGMEALVEQMNLDVARTREILADDRAGAHQESEQP